MEAPGASRMFCNGGARCGEQANSSPAVLSVVVGAAGIGAVDLLPTKQQQDEEETSQELLRPVAGVLRSAITSSNAASVSSLREPGLRRRVSDNAIALRRLVQPCHQYAWLRRTPVSPAIPNPVAPESLAERRTELANGSSSNSNSSSNNSSMGTKMSSCCRLKTPGLTADRRTKSTGNLNQDTAQYFYQYQQHHNNNNPVDVLLLRASLQVSNGSGRSSEKDSLGTHSPKQPPLHLPPQPDLASCATLPVGSDNLATDPATTVICGSLPTYLEYNRSGSPFYGEVSSAEQEASVQQNKELLYSAADRKHPIDHQLRRVLYCSPHIADALGCDQGYGSERSPEDEPPPSPTTASVTPKRPQRPQPPPPMSGMLTHPPEPDDSLGNPLFDPFTLAYPFITDDSIFCVQIAKSANEVGLSFSGGKDSTAPYPGLIRIKRLFPHMPAWNTGALQPGDIVLAVNETPLTGLTNYQALKVLRKADRIITLIVCRPPDDEYRKLSPPIEQPRPPLRAGLGCPSPLITINDGQHQQQEQSLHEKPAYCGFGNVSAATLYHPGLLQPLPDPAQTSCSGEFEIVLTKQQGSLGFTMHKEDDSVLGHCVRALVREPALSDGRIRPGDKIVAVNGVLLAGMTHEEAVLFTRQTGDTVRLRLYRDQSPSPTSSPTSESTLLLLGGGGGRGAKAGPGRAVPPGQRLRPEALNLLANLAAHRKQRQQQQDGAGTSLDRSDRRLIRKAYVHCPSGQCRHNCVPATLQHHHSSDVTRSPVSGLDGTVSYDGGGGGSGGGDDGDVDEDDFANTFYADEELEDVVRADDFERLLLDDGSSSSSFGRHARLPVAEKAPALGPDSPVSLPCETFLVACTTDQDLRQAEDCDGQQTREAIYVQHFAHKALYASVTVPTRAGAAEMVEAVERGGRKGLMKWKGATLLPDEKAEKTAEPSTGNPRAEPADAGSSNTGNHSVDDSSQSPTPDAATTATTTPTTGQDEMVDFQIRDVTDDGAAGCEVITVELNRGWNSRLGFSLSQDVSQPAHQATGARTVISAIHPDSVAARDGRLRVGDVLLKVNEESVERMPTASVIELIRIVRGAIFIKLLRPTGSDTMQATKAPSDTMQDADGDGNGEAGYTILPMPTDSTPFDQQQH
ncbi:uncharacterized protein LOC131213407 [Anopheles bellator]|uniref:uncharacterized protein LOC131213407 n=1 Tax=Anopheles bellator TaxID=139047 RepID=UPI0026476358|nr:uncharacterized protein LOC131213407 [Anopheles bellator]